MTTPPDILWREAGRPEAFISGQIHDDGPYRCAVCGVETARAVTLVDTFTGNEDGWPRFHDQHGEWVCLGCDFASKGRWKDQFRLWSILWCEDGGLADHHPTVYEHLEEATYPVRLEPVVEQAGDRVQITNRGGLTGLLDLLLDPPDGRWWAALADSGKKKIHRFASVTAGDPWTVTLEYQDVTSTVVEFARVLFDVASMRALGVSADRIRSGRLDPTWDREHADRLRWHNAQLDDVRGHPRLDLALFCCTQETTDEAGRSAGRALVSRGAARPGSPLASGHSSVGVDRRRRAERVVAARAGGTGMGGEDRDEPEEDGRADGRLAGDRRPDEEDRGGDQIDLFGGP